MSKPATQVPMARASSQGSHPAPPPAASQPPTGATARASPRYIWVHVVTRFASEYQNTMARASGDSTRQIHPSCVVARTKATEDTATSPIASPRESTPRGSSRSAVLGFRAS